MIDHIKKWWAVYGATVTLVATQLLPVLQVEISHHPKLAETIATICVILAKVSKSPQQGAS